MRAARLLTTRLSILTVLRHYSIYNCYLLAFFSQTQSSVHLSLDINSLQIYICGGFNGIQCLETCEFYEPETDQWTAITQMNSLRSGFGLTAYAGKIYAVSTKKQNKKIKKNSASEVRFSVPTKLCESELMLANANFLPACIPTTCNSSTFYSGISIMMHIWFM